MTGFGNAQCVRTKGYGLCQMSVDGAEESCESQGRSVVNWTSLRANLPCPCYWVVNYLVMMGRDSWVERAAKWHLTISSMFGCVANSNST